MAADEAGHRGEAVVISGGKFTKCAADATPSHILAQDVAAAASPATRPLAIPVDEMQEWETALGAVNSTAAPVVLGTKLTLHTDGLTLSYVTEDGVFELTGLANTGNAAAGDRVVGRFRR